VSDPGPPPTHSEPPRSVAGEVGRAGASLLEGWARDTVIGGAVLFSLIACLAGFAGGGPAWIVLGFAVGLPGAVLPFVAMARWSAPVTWLVSLVALAASLAVIVAAASRS
jgi:hypothetical protein